MATQPLPGNILDSPPPLPPQLAQTQSPPPLTPAMGQLAGGGMMGTGGVQAGAAIHQAMNIEAQVMDLARTLPGFAPVADQIIMLLRSGVVQATQGVSAPSAPIGGPASTLGGIGGGNMIA